jgi:hypothetical protein
LSVDNPVPATYYVGLLVRLTEVVDPYGENISFWGNFVGRGRTSTVKTTDIRWETQPFNYDPRACGPGREGDCGYSRSTTVALWDSPATTVTVGGISDEDRTRQASLLSLCDGNGASSCTFAVNRDGNNQPVTPVRGYGLPHQVSGFGSRPNDTTSPSTNTYTVTDATTQGTSWSLNASLKPKIPFLDKIVDATISGSYGGNSSATHTFSQSITLTTQPGETGYIFTASPVLRYTGTWTVILGNPQNGQGTTYTLTDTHIDRLDTSTGAKFLLYTCKTGSDSCRTAGLGKVPADLPTDFTSLDETTQGAPRETRNV